jgi:hypothetical protein
MRDKGSIMPGLIHPKGGQGYAGSLLYPKPSSGGPTGIAALPGLTGWYAANVQVYSDHGSTPAVNNVDLHQGQWNDQSGSGYNLQGGGVNNGANYKTNVQNGLPGILFGGSAGLAVPSSPPNVAQPCTVIAVLNITAWFAANVLWSDTSADNCRLETLNATPEVDLYAGTAFSPSFTGLTIGTAAVVVCVYNGAASFVDINDGAHTVGSPGASGFATGWTLGTNHLFGNGFSGYIHEWLITANAMSTGNQTATVSALRTKWGI